MLCTILPVLYLSVLFPPLGLRKMAAPCQSPEGARSDPAKIQWLWLGLGVWVRVNFVAMVKVSKLLGSNFNPNPTSNFALTLI